MKKISYAILFIIFFQFVYAQFQFISPLPNSRNISVSHNIIIRQQDHLDPSSLKSSFFRIEGSKSGIHNFKLILCDDGKTINLNPETHFEYAELVTVTISKGLVTTKQKVIDAYSFSFSTHRKWTSKENDKIKIIDSLLELQEFNPVGLSEDSGSALKMTGMFTITTNTNPSPGYLFFDCRSSTTPPSIYNSIDVISNNGDSIYQRLFSVFPYDFKILKNGYLETYQKNIEKFLIMDSNFAVIDTYEAVSGYVGDPHELEILPNNNAFLIAGEVQFMVLPGNTDSAEVLGTVIQELDIDRNVIFEWRSFDHVGIEESQHVDFSIEPVDYIHTNSIELDTDGNIIVSHRHLDQITKIDVSTGDFIWRLGGLYNEFTFINDSDRFSYQHDCRRLPDGNITLYDDGNYHTPARSSAKEYQLDELNKTATLVWSYSHPDVNGIIAYYSATGSVQRLPNGNTLIGWGRRSNVALPSMTEVDSSNNIVWELKLSQSQNLIDYRVHKYEWDPCARPTFKFLNTENISTHSATITWSPVANPSQQYEVQYKKHDDSVWLSQKVNVSQYELDLADLDANTDYDWRIQSWCDTLSGESSQFTDTVNFTTLLSTLTPNTRQSIVDIYPNPANDEAIITCSCKISKIRILNSLGQEVMNISVNDENVDLPLEIPVSNLSPGNYFIEVTHGDEVQMKKLMIQ